MRGRGGGGMGFPGFPGRGGGMGLPIPIPLGRGLGGIGVLVILGIMLFMTIGPSLLGGLRGGGGGATTGGGGGGGWTSPSVAPGPSPSGPSRPDVQADFVSVVLASTEDTWPGILQTSGRTYDPPTLTLFDGVVRSACGRASAAVGPFYCPGDRNVYLDLSFFRELEQRFGAPGDFAQAYVIAHEVGHHVQTLMGTTDAVDRHSATLSREQQNELSVRVELQADCYAGIWGQRAAQQGILEPGDVEEGMRAAAAIGDDRLQRQSQGYVVPESFTHGTSQQRVAWFRRGFETGSLEACNTLKSASL